MSGRVVSAFQKLINNLWQNTKEITAVKESSYVIKHTQISQNFCFDFLGLYNIYIKNSFVNKVTRWVENESLLKLFKTLAIPASSDIKALMLVF